jgi:hypothetical protein
MSRHFGFPKNLASDHEIAALLSSEISRDNFAVRAPEIVDAIRSVLSDIDLPVRIRDFVNDVQGLDLSRPPSILSKAGYGSAVEIQHSILVP